MKNCRQQILFLCCLVTLISFHAAALEAKETRYRRTALGAADFGLPTTDESTREHRQTTTEEARLYFQRALQQTSLSEPPSPSPVAPPTPRVPRPTPVANPTPPTPVRQPVPRPTRPTRPSDVDPPVRQPVSRPVRQPVSRPVRQPVDRPVRQPVRPPVRNPAARPNRSPRPVREPVQRTRSPSARTRSPSLRTRSPARNLPTAIPVANILADCRDPVTQSPSGSPTTSTMPSTFPSAVPSFLPTISITPSASVNPTPHCVPTSFPSDMPSEMPTVSSAPSVSESPSMQPSSSHKPSSSPNPTNIPLAPIPVTPIGPNLSPASRPVRTRSPSARTRSPSRRTRSPAVDPIDIALAPIPVTPIGRRNVRAEQSPVAPKKKNRRHLSTMNADEPQEKTQFDFVVAGFPKCGTTTLLKAFDAHEETDMGATEQCSVANDNMADVAVLKEMDKSMEQLSQLPSIKRSFKCPTAIYNHKSITRLQKHSPNAKLIVGVRHPVWMVQSYYNYRVTELYDQGSSEVIPSFDEVMAGTISWKGVSADSARYEMFLMQMGKTDISPQEMLSFVGFEEYNLAIRPNHFKVFLYSVEQMEDDDEERNAAFRQSLQNYLELSTPIPAFTHENKNHFVGDQAHPETIDICEDRYLALRRRLMRQGRKTATWLRKFMQSKDVVVANDAHFGDLLESWGRDPCLGPEVAVQ